MGLMAEAYLAKATGREKKSVLFPVVRLGDGGSA